MAELEASRTVNRGGAADMYSFGMLHSQGMSHQSSSSAGSTE